MNTFTMDAFNDGFQRLIIVQMGNLHEFFLDIFFINESWSL